MPTLPAINDLTQSEIRDVLTARGEPAYRATQISEWLYRRRVRSFDEMTNLPASLRGALAREFSILRVEQVSEIVSPEDDTTKMVLGLPDGLAIESVFLPHRRGATLCVSTQVGCAFRCRFCATGRGGLKRNLSAAEIVDQVLFAKEKFAPGATGDSGEFAAEGKAAKGKAVKGKAVKEELAPDERPFSNIVLMGMGEPLANYDNVVKAIELLTKEVGIGSRRITISTAGVADKIMKLADLPYEIGLAVSLNAPSDEVRREIMPVAAKTPLGKLMNAVRCYVAKKGRIVTFEYVLIPGLNDAARDAHALASLTRDIPAKINLIMLNPFPGSPYERAEDESARRFMAILGSRAKKATLRKSLGSDILAGCGQLGGQTLLGAAHRSGIRRAVTHKSVTRKSVTRKSDQGGPPVT